MSEVIIKGIKSHYIVKGDKKRCVILMHGWGQNTEMMEYIQDYLKDYFTVYNIDFPGFGKSENPDRTYSTVDYTDWLKQFLANFNVVDPILIGHSFGCRIAIRYASENSVYKMILTGAAGLRNKRGADYYLRVYSYKFMKQVFKLPIIKNYQKQFQKKSGSSDYQNATGVMKSTFVSVVNENVIDILNKVSCEVLLVYGENDDATPVWMGKVMEEKMQNATLVIFEKQGHFAYYYQKDRFNAVLEAFLKGDYCE